VNRPIEVFVFGSQEEYHRFAPDTLGGHARRADDENQIALGIEQASDGTGDLYHELVHTVLHNDPDRRFPSWFHEGLAVFLGTSVLRGDVLTIGGLSPTAVAWIRHSRPLPLRTLLASPASGQRNVTLFYADAWAFVHFGLLSPSLGGPDRRKAFGEFVARVSRGEPWEPAFQSSFQATPEEIAEEHERHREKLSEIRVMTLLNVTLESETPRSRSNVDRLEIARQLTQLADGGYEVGIESMTQLFDLLLAADPGIRGDLRAHPGGGIAPQLDLAGRAWQRLPGDRREGRRLAGGGRPRPGARGRPPARRPQLAGRRRAEARHGRVPASPGHAPDRLPRSRVWDRTMVRAKHEIPRRIAALTHAVEINPEWPEVRLDLALLLIRSNAPGAALPHLDYVIEAYPGTPYSSRAEYCASRRAEPRSARRAEGGGKCPGSDV
jgi:hypothetical protein